jgi:hypothetical protein
VKRVSYSQYSLWDQCPRQYKLKYIDKVSLSIGSIHTIFGTGMHETIQQYLVTMFADTRVKANALDLNAILMENMKVAFREERTKLKENGENDPTKICTKAELKEFYNDGVEFLTWFKKPKNQAKFYRKKGMKLIGIELPLNIKLRDGIENISFLDIVLEDLVNDEIIIIDFKTSTKGWGKWQRGSDVKKNQILLYKRWYSDQYIVSESKIRVQFHIMRRKLPEDSDFTIPRMSKFLPSDGKISVNRAVKSFDTFLNTVFNDDGTFKNVDDDSFVKKPSKLCDWCPFYKIQCDPYDKN